MGLVEVSISDVQYVVGRAEILRDVTATVDEGEVVSIVGPSGADKGTLLRTINRLVEPTSGEIFLDGVSTREINPLELRRRVGGRSSNYQRFSGRRLRTLSSTGCTW
jgi:ABC-type proline/glycine betaine transport system ATPase subunit